MTSIYVIRLPINTQLNTINMSSNNTNNNASASSKPFCKVCKDAGCSEGEYTSHFVKDQPGPNGKVVCPTLLNQSCRICNQLGHTSSYCKQYKTRPSREEPRHKETRREESRDYRRAEYRHEEPRDYRRHEYRREEYRDYRHDDRDYRRDEYRHEEPRDYRCDEYHRSEDSRDYRRDDYRHEETQRRAPYAHPHGPRVRLQLEAPALYAGAATATDAVPVHAAKREILVDDEELSSLPVTKIDVRKVDLKTEPLWGDEPLVDMGPEHRRILEEAFMKYLIGDDEDFDLIVAADEDNMGGRRAINNGD